MLAAVRTAILVHVAHELTWLLPLAPLFAALLSGCNLSCGGPIKKTLVLSPDEYANWSNGMPPDAPTGDVGDSAAGATGSGTIGDTTGSDTNTLLSDEEICMMVCEAEFPSPVESCKLEFGMLQYGYISVECILMGECGGRRHVCVRSHGAYANPDLAAAWLARAAHDESASVHAFFALAEELAAHSAPTDLLARINIAAADERRHAALVTELARRYHATVPIPAISPTSTRNLLALAVENMVEGCVHETWAALAATHRARHAQDPEVRRIYAEIAADETNHAQLAWEIDAWLFRQLSDADRAIVTAARHAAVRRLQASLAATADMPELLALGTPSRASALHLLAGLDAALWSQAA